MMRYNMDAYMSPDIIFNGGNQRSSANGTKL